MYEAKKLGQILLEEGMITEEQLERAIDEQLKTNDSLGFVLVKMGYITEDVLYHFLAVQFNVRFVDVAVIHIEEEVIKSVTAEIVRKYKILPIEKKPGKLILATSNPLDPSLTMNLKYDIHGGDNLEISFVVTTMAALNDAIEKYYPVGNVLDEAVKEAGGDDNIEIEILEEKKPGEEKEEAAEGDIEGANSPVVKYVNYILENAVSKKASDIHINPYEKKIVLRFRIDGALVDMTPPSVQYKKAIASRLKLMAGLNIIEKRLPQDGRINYKMNNGKTIDLRVSTLPSVWGENIVMRLLYSEAQNLDLTKLGLSPVQFEGIQKGLDAPYGMVLITGPTGSGKSTTLYSMVSRINEPHINIMTAEDPVEYRLPHIIQVQVNNVAGLDFANILRSFLRQDPDVILVGEIRDSETASISVKAALTGHLVLSTLHTNDAPATITRLVDMGIDPLYVGSSVVTVVSQKLVRRVCENCKKPLKEVDYAKAKKNGIPGELFEGGTFFEGEGCPVCNYTGYKGRMAAYEVMHINPAIREIIFKKGTLNDIKRVVWKQGMATVRESALRLMREGRTTLEEVIRESLSDKPLAEFHKLTKF